MRSRPPEQRPDSAGRRMRCASVCLTWVAAACGSETPTGSSLDAGAAPAHVDAGTPAPALDAATSSPPVTALPSVCSSDEWCWDGPGLHGNSLHGVAASSPDDIWAVGELGLVLQFDGALWRSRWAPTREHLRAIHAGRERVWAVGDAGTVLEYAEGSWRALAIDALPPQTDLRGVTRDAAGDLWLVGAGGIALSGRDGAWSLATTGVATGLNAVWTDGEEVWLAGDDGVVLWRVDGVWVRVDAGTSEDLLAIDGAGDELWIAGTGGEVRRYEPNAARFERPGGEGAAPDANATALDVNGQRVHVATSDGRVYVWDGGATCSASGDAGVASETCPRWTAVRHAGQEAPLLGVWADREQTVAVGAFGALVTWQGPERTLVSEAALDHHLDVSGNAAGELWVGGDELLRRDATGWTPVERDSPRAVYALQALQGGETLVAGTAGMARRWSGEVWESLDVAADAWLQGLWSDGATGWLVGSGGRAFGLLNRRLWTALDTPTDRDLLAVWSSPLGEAWAVGASGVVLRHDGVRWAAIPSGPDGGVDADLRGVWGTSSTDIWAVGTGGTILHWDGTRWEAAAEAASFSLNDVWGRGPSDVWAVGSGGTVLHYDGSSWQPEFSGTPQALHGVWGDNERVWAVGEHGALLVKRLSPAGDAPAQ